MQTTFAFVSTVLSYTMEQQVCNSLKTRNNIKKTKTRHVLERARTIQPPLEPSSLHYLLSIHVILMYEEYQHPIFLTLAPIAPPGSCHRLCLIPGLRCSHPQAVCEKTNGCWDLGGFLYLLVFNCE